MCQKRAFSSQLSPIRIIIAGCLTCTIAPWHLLQVCVAVSGAVVQALQHCASSRGTITELQAWRAARDALGDTGVK